MVSAYQAGPLESLPAHVAKALADALPTIARFIYDVFSIPSVKRIAFSADGVQIDLWILLEGDADADKRVYAIEREHLSRLDAVPFDLHVVWLSRTKEENLPPLQTILER